MNSNQEQKHPQEKTDREIINQLLQGQVNSYSLSELARLRIRYDDFPGAREIQRDLDLLLTKWNLDESQLFEKTRKIHAIGEVYRQGTDEKQEDWS